MGTGRRQNVASSYAADGALDCRRHTKRVRTLSDRLLPLFPTQTEIEAEHWFKRFRLCVLKLSDARQIDSLKSCSNPFDVGVLPPDGEREHFDEYLTSRF